MWDLFVWFAGATFALGMLAGLGGVVAWRKGLAHVEDARVQYEEALGVYRKARELVVARISHEAERAKGGPA